MSRLIRGLQRFRATQADAASAEPFVAPLQTPESLAILLERVRALHLSDLSRSTANLRSAGEFASAVVGRGLDFEEIRAYVPGDNVRDMDWRTTARRGKPYIKRYRETRQRSVFLVMDRGASMRFATRGQLKVVQAVRIAAAYGYACAENGACIGGVLYDQRAAAIGCRPGLRGTLEWLHYATRPCPPVDSPGHVEPSVLNAAIASVAPPGSELLWLSDFRHLEEDTKPWLIQLAQRYILRAVRVTDSAEISLPPVGLAPFACAGGLRWIDTTARRVQLAFAAASVNERARVKKLFASVGVALSECTTQDDAVRIAASVLARSDA